MTISVMFDSLEEMKDFARGLLQEDSQPARVPDPEPEPEDEPAAVEEPAPEPEPAKAEPEPVKAEQEKKSYTMTEVRKFLGDLRKSGKKEAVSALIGQLGYTKFTDIPEDKYPELMEKAGEL